MSNKSRFEKVIEKDLELLWLIQDVCRRRPAFDRFMSKLVSKYPWNDIINIIWVVFVIGVIETGMIYFWVVLGNLVVVYCKLVCILLPALY